MWYLSRNNKDAISAQHIQDIRPEWQSGTFGRWVEMEKKNSHGLIFLFCFWFSVVTHEGVKRLGIKWISSTPRCTNQHAVAIKLVTEGADDENGWV